MGLILTVLLVFSLLAAWIAVIYVGYRAWAPVIRSRRMKVQTASATVAAKRDERGPVFRHDAVRLGDKTEPGDLVKDEPMHWFVSFECSYGATDEFSVPEKLFDSVSVGDEGELAWRGSLFVGFRRKGDKSDWDWDQTWAAKY